MKEALKLALEQRITDYLSAGGLFNPELADHVAVRDLLIDCRKALAQPEQEPVGKLQEATAERAWFTIAELNAWADKKLSENPHWVMPKDEPERDEPPPQRTWVGLTDDEIDNVTRKQVDALLDHIYEYGTAAEGIDLRVRAVARVIEAKLKEKNT